MAIKAITHCQLSFFMGRLRKGSKDFVVKAISRSYADNKYEIVKWPLKMLIFHNEKGSSVWHYTTIVCERIFTIDLYG